MFDCTPIRNCSARNRPEKKVEKLGSSSNFNSSSTKVFWSFLKLLTTFSSNFHPFTGLLKSISILFGCVSSFTQLPADVPHKTRFQPSSFWMSERCGPPGTMLVSWWRAGLESTTLERPGATLKTLCLKLSIQVSFAPFQWLSLFLYTFLSYYSLHSVVKMLVKFLELQKITLQHLSQ